MPVIDREADFEDEVSDNSIDFEYRIENDLRGSNSHHRGQQV
jgi:hypothetical protein